MIDIHGLSLDLRKNKIPFEMTYIPGKRCQALQEVNNITNEITETIDEETFLEYLNNYFGDEIMLTPEGGVAIKYINKTGAPTVKGYCVTTGSIDNSVILVPVNVPNCIGVFYENGVADGLETWVVISGKAQVYFWGNTTAGQLARTGLTADTGEVAGQAISEAVPTPPFATDKHFCEIGHVLESRIGAGLALVNLHFN